MWAQHPDQTAAAADSLGNRDPRLCIVSRKVKITKHCFPFPVKSGLLIWGFSFNYVKGMTEVWRPELSTRGQVYLEFLELFGLANFLVNHLLTNSSGNPVWHHFTKNLLITFLGSTGLAPEKVPTTVKQIFCCHICYRCFQSQFCLTQLMGNKSQCWKMLGTKIFCLAVYQMVYQNQGTCHILMG